MVIQCRNRLGAALLLGMMFAPTLRAAGTHEMPTGNHSTTTPAADNRVVADFPPEFKRQELTNMRNHLEALQLITQYLGEGDFQAASDVAEQRLTRGGMSMHDRHQAAQYMPKQMLAMGASMHRAAGNFAVVAQDAAVTGDMAAALGALAKVQERCVACHRVYRMK